jgi:hypothetical protein
VGTGTDLLAVVPHWNGSRWQIPNKVNVAGTFEDVAADQAGDTSGDVGDDLAARVAICAQPKTNLRHLTRS